jgi:pseudaminic acid synthase
MKIGPHSIGRGHRPFIIAEMSGNHNQSLDRALQMVEVAAACGVQAIKFQTYTADTMTIDFDEGEFFIADPSSLWQGKSLYQLYQEAHTPWDWHAPLFKRARELGLVPFSTPFDETAVDFLESLDAPCYKIASFENTDLPLIRKVASTGKPVIISTGMADVGEIDQAVRAVREAGGQGPILLKCTSSYPATPHDTNLMTLPHLRDLFACEVGLSDHTMGVGAAVASVALGATVVEKHFTLARADGGVDSAFSLEPEELRQLAVETERAWQALGRIAYGATKNEEKSKVYRRSVYVTRDIAAGEAFTTDNIRCIRPGLGLAPKHFPEVLGRKATQAVARGTPLSWALIA